jgi:preprotein translocase subunit SecE
VNRQMKRMMQKQGQLAPDGTPARREPTKPAPRPPKERVGAPEYLRQVRAELRKVAWPTRPEVVNYSIIVLVALIFLTALIFVFDYAFGKFVIFLFQ